MQRRHGARTGCSVERKGQMGREKEAERNIQWHPAFVCAMSMEFAEDRERLVFEREYQLNTKPLQIDLLIIKKERDVRIRNEIGHFFAGYNVLEYKAPGDRLDADVYYKAVAYGCLYKAYGETVDGRKAEDITVTLVREARPRELLGYFRDAGTAVEHVHPGIWHLSGSRILFPTQIVAIRELEGGEPRMAADADGPAVETGRGPVSGTLAQAGGKGGAGIRGIDTGGVCEGEQGMAETEEGREGYGTGTDGDHGTGTAPGGRPGQGGRHARRYARGDTRNGKRAARTRAGKRADQGGRDEAVWSDGVGNHAVSVKR